MRTCNLNKKFNYYKHRISYLTGTCYNFETENFFHRFATRGYASWAFLYCLRHKSAVCQLPSNHPQYNDNDDAR